MLKVKQCRYAGHWPIWCVVDNSGAVLLCRETEAEASESQRAMVAGNIANMRQGARTDIKHRANLPEVSNAEAAAMMNVSERSVKSAKKVTP